MTLHGIMQQSHSTPPQSQGMHGFLMPFTPPLPVEADDEDEVEGSVLSTGRVIADAAIVIDLISADAKL